MPSRLSSLLVRDGLVGVRRMEKAFQRQVIYGGSLDTILLELGMVPEERLCQYLALASGLPPASRAEIEHVEPAAVATLPLESAQAYRAIPLAIEGEAVRMAVCAPIDLAALEDLADQIDRPLRPLLVPEYRWHLILANAYGASVPQRYAQLAAQMEKDPATQPVGRARTIIVENEPERDTIVGATPLGTQPLPLASAGDEGARARASRITEDVLPATPRTTSRPGEAAATAGQARVRSPSQSGDTAPMRSRSPSQSGVAGVAGDASPGSQSDEITAVRAPRPSAGVPAEIAEPSQARVGAEAAEGSSRTALPEPPTLPAAPPIDEQSATVRPAVHEDTPQNRRRRGVTLIGVRPVRALSELLPQGDLFNEGELSPASGIPAHVRGELGDSDDTPPRRLAETGRREAERGRRDTELQFPPVSLSDELSRFDPEDEPRIVDVEDPTPLPPAPPAPPRTRTAPMPAVQASEGSGSQPHAVPRATTRQGTAPPVAAAPPSAARPATPTPSPEHGGLPSHGAARPATSPPLPATTRPATSPPLGLPATRAGTVPPLPASRAPTVPPGGQVDAALDALRGGPSFTTGPVPLAKDIAAISVREARELLTHAEHRDDVFVALLRAVRHVAQWAGLLTVQGGVAIGRLALAHPELDTEQISSVLIPLDAPSPIRTALTSKRPYVGPLAKGDPAVDSMFLRMGGIRPPSLVVLPLVLRERVVALVVAHRADRDVSFGDVADLLPLATLATEAIGRLILRSKSETGKPASRAQTAPPPDSGMGARARTAPPDDASAPHRAITSRGERGERRPTASADPDDPDPEPALRLDDASAGGPLDDDGGDTDPGEGELPRGWHGHVAEGAASAGSGGIGREGRTRGRISEAPWRARAASAPSPWTSSGQSGPVPVLPNEREPERASERAVSGSTNQPAPPTRPSSPSVPHAQQARPSSPSAQPRSRSGTAPGTTPAAAPTRPSSPSVPQTRQRLATSPAQTPAVVEAPMRPSSPSVAPFTSASRPSAPSIPPHAAVTRPSSPSIPPQPTLRPSAPSIPPQPTLRPSAPSIPPQPTLRPSAPSVPPQPGRPGAGQPPPAASSSGASSATSSGAAPVALPGDLVLELIEDRDAPEYGAALDEAIARAEELLPAIAERFPGALDVDRYAVTGRPLRAAQYGGLLELVTRMGPLASELLIEKLAAASRDIRFYAAVCLIEIRPKNAISALFDRLFDPDFGVRACVVEALQGYAHRELEAGMTRMRQALHSDDPNRVAAAASAVAELADREALIDLISALPRGERFAEPCRRALMSLTKQDFGLNERKWGKWWDDHHRRHRIEWLIDGLQHKESELRAQAIIDLRRLTGESFGYESEASKRDRDIAHRRWLTWWNEVGRLRFLSNDNERHRPTALLPLRRDDR